MFVISQKNILLKILSNVSFGIGYNAWILQNDIPVLFFYSKCAIDALEDMCSWLEEGTGEVAVYDATNTTLDRRQLIYDTVVEKYGYKLFFVESYCNDPNIIEANIRVNVVEI